TKDRRSIRRAQTSHHSPAVAYAAEMIGAVAPALPPGPLRAVFERASPAVVAARIDLVGPAARSPTLRASAGRRSQADRHGRQRSARLSHPGLQSPVAIVDEGLYSRRGNHQIRFNEMEHAALQQVGRNLHWY